MHFAPCQRTTSAVSNCQSHLTPLPSTVSSEEPSETTLKKEEMQFPRTGLYKKVEINGAPSHLIPFLQINAAYQYTRLLKYTPDF